MPKKYEILKKRELSPDTTLISVYAPLIAKKAASLKKYDASIVR